MTTWVYFLRPVGQEGPVKIGCSTMPRGRLKTYASWAPWPLEIAALLEGSLRLEAKFHARFREQHSHHEWFHASAELTACIEEIAAGKFDPSSLPEPQQLPRMREPLSEKAKQNRSLRHRISAHTYMAGMRSPPWLEQARKNLSLDGEMRQRAIQTIEVYLSDPLRFGIPYEHAWAPAKLAAYKARHAKSPSERKGVAA